MPLYLPLYYPDVILWWILSNAVTVIQSSLTGFSLLLFLPILQVHFDDIYVNGTCKFWITFPL